MLLQQNSIWMLLVLLERNVSVLSVKYQTVRRTVEIPHAEELVKAELRNSHPFSFQEPQMTRRGSGATKRHGGRFADR